MKTKVMPLLAAVILIPVLHALAAAYTPQPGSSDRREICDSLREYLIHHVATRPLPQPIVFKIDFIRVDEDYAWFEGIPMFKNGSFATDYLPDMGYALVLKRSGAGWRVVHDLSRSDVPDDSEVAQLRKELADVPSAVMSDFWRRLLKR